MKPDQAQRILDIVKMFSFGDGAEVYIGSTKICTSAEVKAMCQCVLALDNFTEGIIFNLVEEMTAREHDAIKSARDYRKRLLK